MGIGDDDGGFFCARGVKKVGRLPNGDWRHVLDMNIQAGYQKSEDYPMGIGD